MAATNKALWNVEQSSGTSSHLLSGLRPPHCITQVPGLHGYKNNWHKNPTFSLYLIIYLFAAAVIKYVHFEKEFGFLVSEVLPNYGCREMMCSACHKHGTKKKSKCLTGIEPVLMTFCAQIGCSKHWATKDSWRGGPYTRFFPYWQFFLQERINQLTFTRSFLTENAKSSICFGGF